MVVQSKSHLRQRLLRMAPHLMLAVAINTVNSCTLSRKSPLDSPNPSNAKKGLLILPMENPWIFLRMARRTCMITVGVTHILLEGDHERRVANLKPRMTRRTTKSLKENRNRLQLKNSQARHHTCKLKKVPRQAKRRWSRRQSTKKMWLITRLRNKRSGYSMTSLSRLTMTLKQASILRWKLKWFLRPL